MSEDNLKSVVEALLFSSERPLTLEQLKAALDNLDIQEIRRALEEIKAEYEQGGRGMRIIEIAGGFQMVTFPGFATFLHRLYKDRHIEKLSKPALETLAIIAYKQPVTKMEIESFRNVNVDGVMGSLLEKNLIRVVGRKKAPGRPHVFGTTKQFLEHFGLKSLEELPKIEELSVALNSGSIPPEEQTEKIAEGLNESQEAAQENR